MLSLISWLLLAHMPPPLELAVAEIWLPLIVLLTTVLWLAHMPPPLELAVAEIWLPLIVITYYCALAGPYGHLR